MPTCLYTARRFLQTVLNTEHVTHSQVRLPTQEEHHPNLACRPFGFHRPFRFLCAVPDQIEVNRCSSGHNDGSARSTQ
jgi:hypothetical protein